MLFALIWLADPPPGPYIPIFAVASLAGIVVVGLVPFLLTALVDVTAAAIVAAIGWLRGHLRWRARTQR